MLGHVASFLATTGDAGMALASSGGRGVSKDKSEVVLTNMNVG